MQQQLTESQNMLAVRQQEVTLAQKAVAAAGVKVCVKETIFLGRTLTKHWVAGPRTEWSRVARARPSRRKPWPGSGLVRTNAPSGSEFLLGGVRGCSVSPKSSPKSRPKSPALTEVVAALRSPTLLWGSTLESHRSLGSNQEQVEGKSEGKSVNTRIASISRLESRAGRGEV